MPGPRWTEREIAALQIVYPDRWLNASGLGLPRKHLSPSAD